MFFRLTGCVLLLMLTVVSGYGQITNIAAIRQLTVEEAEQGLPVELEVQLSHLHPRRRGIFVFDGTYGIYVNLPSNASRFDDLKPGAIVHLKGHTTSGDFTDSMMAEEVEVVGWAPLPEPRKFHSYEIYSTSVALDCEWVTVIGRIVGAAQLLQYDSLMLEIEVSGSKAFVQVPMEPDTMERTAELMFQRVSFPAVVGTIFNRHRQMTGRVFHVNSMKDFSLFGDDVQWTDTDVRPIETLLRAGQNYNKALHTHGLVTFVGKNTIYVRGAVTSLKVATLRLADLRPGDYVDLTGFIWAQPISPAFRAREIKVLERRALPDPVEIDVGGRLDPDWNYELVRTSATLVEVGKASGDGSEIGPPVLFCRAGKRVFEVRLPDGMNPGEHLKPGALLGLTGICSLLPNQDPRWTYFVENLRMELRGPADLAVLRKASWWTAARLAWVVAVVLSAAMLFLVWVLMLRKTVARQTGMISEQIERESVLNERQRLARELHDTLEQGLAGVALQLRSSLKQIEAGPQKGRSALELAQGMLRYCRDESRNSILDLRGGLLEKMDLPAALREALQPLAEECGAVLEVEVSGMPRRLKQYAERHLLRIAKEAATNAVRHAAPGRLRVELAYGPAELSLTIRDDGAGFDVDGLAKSERFGLQGMRERANRIHAKINIQSRPESGTTVCVELDSTEEWELEES